MQDRAVCKDHLVGVRHIGAPGMAALAPTVIWSESLAATMMAHTATGLKLTGEIARRKHYEPVAPSSKKASTMPLIRALLLVTNASWGLNILPSGL